jgi:EAL domain-containing protein (putative c-di-GMP-specific phosphodiesterase class I)
MRSVDVAMYEAKRTRSTICLYHSESDAHSRDRLALVGELRRALSAQEFVLHYQVTRDFATGDLHGAEALIRWHHPTRGLLLPDVFIPVAERVGLICPLTRVVLRMALLEMTRLDANGHRLNMSVNISRLDLEEARLPIDLAALLEEFAIDPQRLTLEITETSLGEYPLRARVRISQLRALGVRVSIDDFGVGYSSMSQLLELPVDELKIDKSFVLALAKDARASAVIHSTIELARALRISVVAEGVEDEESFRTLRALGADVAQGHFIARPLTSEELDAVLTHPTERRFLISPET